MIYKERSYEDSVVLVTFELPVVIAGQNVNLVGDFNAWNQHAMPMQRSGDGTWKLTLPLQEDREFQFRYLVDGKRWFNDWEADSYVPNPYGGKNSVVTTRHEYEA